MTLYEIFWSANANGVILSVHNVTNTNRIYSGVVFVFDCGLFAQSTCPNDACTAMTERIKSEIVHEFNKNIHVLHFRFVF